MKMNMGSATMTQFSMTFQIRSTVIEVYAQSTPIGMAKSISMMMASIVKRMDKPPSNQAIGYPVNTEKMKPRNMQSARISLGLIVLY